MNRLSHRHVRSVMSRRRMHEAYGKDYLDHDTFEEAYEEAAWDEIEDIIGGLNARHEQQGMKFLSPDIYNFGDSSNSMWAEGSLEVWISNKYAALNGDSDEPTVEIMYNNDPSAFEAELEDELESSFELWGVGLDYVVHDVSAPDGVRFDVYIRFLPDIEKEEWYDGKMEQDPNFFESRGRVSRRPSQRRLLTRRSARRMRRR